MTCFEFVRGVSVFSMIFSDAECHDEAIYTILFHKDVVLQQLWSFCALQSRSQQQKTEIHFATAFMVVKLKEFEFKRVNDFPRGTVFW